MADSQHQSDQPEVQHDASEGASAPTGSNADFPLHFFPQPEATAEQQASTAVCEPAPFVSYVLQPGESADEGEVTLTSFIAQGAIEREGAAQQVEPCDEGEATFTHLATQGGAIQQIEVVDEEEVTVIGVAAQSTATQQAEACDEGEATAAGLTTQEMGYGQTEVVGEEETTGKGVAATLIGAGVAFAAFEQVDIVDSQGYGANSQGQQGYDVSGYDTQPIPPGGSSVPPPGSGAGQAPPSSPPPTTPVATTPSGAPKKHADRADLFGLDFALVLALITFLITGLIPGGFFNGPPGKPPTGPPVTQITPVPVLAPTPTPVVIPTSVPTATPTPVVPPPAQTVPIHQKLRCKITSNSDCIDVPIDVTIVSFAPNMPANQTTMKLTLVASEACGGVNFVTLILRDGTGKAYQPSGSATTQSFTLTAGQSLDVAALYALVPATGSTYTLSATLSCTLPNMSGHILTAYEDTQYTF